MEDPQPTDLPQYACPACGGEVDPGEPDQPPTQCPHCGEPLFVAPEPSEDAYETTDEDEAAAEELRQKREQELSELRIRQIASLRRGAIRSRSWLIIGAIVCAVGVAQAVFLAIRDYRAGLWLSPTGDVLFAIAGAMIFVYLFRRIGDLSREVRDTRLPEPPTPPDFSGLSDGSQHWKNLDEMSNRDQ